MSKKHWGLFGGLIFVILVLSGTSSYLFFKNRSLGSEPKATSTPDITTTAEMTATPKASPTSSAKPVSTGNKPSVPADTYKILSGETLFSIANKFDLTWSELTLANGIENADKIQAGQTLIIPKNGLVNFGVDNAKAESLQDSVNSGQYQFRLDPVETAKADAAPVYGLTSESTYSLVAKDEKAGTATVSVTVNDQKYTIKLSQPATKGAKGIWAIVSIAPGK